MSRILLVRPYEPKNIISADHFSDKIMAAPVAMSAWLDYLYGFGFLTVAKSSFLSKNLSQLPDFAEFAPESSPTYS